MIRSRPTLLFALVLAVASSTLACPPAVARSHASRDARAARRADSAGSARPDRAAARSPVGPPLTRSAGAGAGTSEVEDAGGGSPQAETDPLVSNGLGSPSCTGAGELSVESRRACETSGFVAAAAPTGDFGLDVHIDTGLLGLSSGGLLATVQDLCVTPVWMALVWVVHALVVMLEWCFTIDLLDSASVGLGIARGLRRMQSALTVPWLATVLAVGGVLTAYNGIVRRRVGESLSEALLALAMMLAGFWVMLNPAGTVGALGEWANQASLGTLAVTTRGSPAAAGRALTDEMHTVFAATIEAPWCYLEFGDVGWCRDPSRLDPRLRAAALALAADEMTEAGCAGRREARAAGCRASSRKETSALEHSAQLLRTARTNGSIFLALPANSPGRNSINDPASLLRAICQSEDATNCRGPSAAEAEFRTNHGTWSRVGGLLLIVAGVSGMLLLLGFLAIRLLSAALFSLLYLLLTPVAVLAPALGESGRAGFRKWATQLLAAVVSKLLFSFLLGTVLVVLSILVDLDALGWWTQWLLMSAFWWSAFVRRHQTWQLAGASSAHDGAGRRRPIVRRVGDTLGARRRLAERTRVVKHRFGRDTTDSGSSRSERSVARARPASPAGAAAGAAAGSAVGLSDLQAQRTLDADARDARAYLESEGGPEQSLSAIDAQLMRIGHHHALAATAGDRVRAARLAGRRERVEGELAQQRGALSDALAVVAGRRRQASPTHERSSEQHDARARFLDAQAALPGAIDAGRQRARERRDYAALAGLADLGSHEYSRLGPPEQRVARLAIDRELAARRERPQLVTSMTESGGAGGMQRPFARPPRDRSDSTPVMRLPSAPVDDGVTPSARPAPPRASDSSVMRDAREVAARRKRQLGVGRP